MQSDKQVTAFTTFNAKGYNEYGKSMLESFADRIPADTRLICYADGFMPDFRHQNIEYRDLNTASKKLANFKRKFSQFEMAHGIIRSRMAPYAITTTTMRSSSATKFSASLTPCKPSIRATRSGLMVTPCANSPFHRAFSSHS